MHSTTVLTLESWTELIFRWWLKKQNKTLIIGLFHNVGSMIITPSVFSNEVFFVVFRR